VPASELWSHFSAVLGSTWLKWFENVEVQCFIFFEDTFDSAPISVALCLKSERSSLQCGFEVFRAINVKHDGFDFVFLPAVFEKDSD
jgi:hypothetical protein